MSYSPAASAVPPEYLECAAPPAPYSEDDLRPGELLHAAHVAEAARSLAHGHVAEDPIVTSETASGQDLQEIQSAVIEERAAARPPTSSEPEVGSRGVAFDEDHVPVRGEAPNYPPRDGAAGDITTSQPAQDSVLSRYGSESGDFFAEGTPSLDERALAPVYDESGALVPPSEYREYSVTGDFPAELSTARRAFGQTGGATQVRTAMSADQMREAGLITLDYEQRPTTPAETAEVEAAVAEEEAAMSIPSSSTREPISPDMATMCDDIEAARARDAAALASDAPAPTTTAASELGEAGEVGELGGEAGEVGELGGEIAHVTPVGAALGTFGAAGGIMQTVDGVGELADGDLDNGIVDTTAGSVGTATGVAATGLLGPEAAAAVAAAPVAVPAALLGVAAAGHHYQAQHDTWGAPTVGEDGEVRHQTSIDFVEANAGAAYDDAHDSVASLFADDEGHVGAVGEAAATTAGVGFGGLMGLGAGMVGLGGDLVGGVQAIGSAAVGLWDHFVD